MYFFLVRFIHIARGERRCDIGGKEVGVISELFIKERSEKSKRGTFFRFKLLSVGVAVERVN